ncbi:hypothetical protein TYRP_002737 [Tyrophagus putrescentiae]|nr:hypothetical protein TYRP_002737 [Tyrophagus putrescentiae]
MRPQLLQLGLAGRQPTGVDGDHLARKHVIAGHADNAVLCNVLKVLLLCAAGCGGHCLRRGEIKGRVKWRQTGQVLLPQRLLKVLLQQLLRRVQVDRGDVNLVLGAEGLKWLRTTKRVLLNDGRHPRDQVLQGRSGWWRWLLLLRGHRGGGSGGQIGRVTLTTIG